MMARFLALMLVYLLIGFYLMLVHFVPSVAVVGFYFAVAIALLSVFIVRGEL